MQRLHLANTSSTVLREPGLFPLFQQQTDRSDITLTTPCILCTDTLKCGPPSLAKINYGTFVEHYCPAEVDGERQMGGYVKTWAR